MKNLAILLTAFVLFSCQKDQTKPAQTENPSVCYFGELTPGAERRFPVKGKPPKDTNQPPVPSGSKVIFLDFDGHTVTGTSWNTGGTSIVAEHSGLTTEQQATVISNVRTHYAGRDVIITTDSTAFWSALSNKRIRVVITTSYEWYQRLVGGVAYTNSFTWLDETPCFVFSSLLNYNLRNIGYVCSHEAGHTLGTRHHSKYDEMCQKITEYTPDAFPDGYGHLMGYPYNWNQCRFGIGQSPYGCDVLTDDVKIIDATLSS
jgi:hypothetical protein